MAAKSEDDRSAIVIKLVSAEDVRAFNFFQKLSLFAVASLISDADDKICDDQQRQRTPTDRNNDGFPEWNHEVRFVLSDSESDSDDFINVDLRHEGGIFGIGDRTVGEVRIPVKDLTDEASYGGVLRMVRYQVKSSDGKANGVLNMSYRYYSGSRKVSYPVVEEVPNLDLIDSTLSCYSSRLRESGLWACCPPQTSSFRPPTMGYEYDREFLYPR